jgi:KaiC/GvpD/RAD55 family RecA-like ATPase
MPRKTLCVPVAPTGVGKSLFMTDWSAYLLTQGYNVLYVTLELAEERIAERVDAKLFDLEI